MGNERSQSGQDRRRPRRLAAAARGAAAAAGRRRCTSGTRRSAATSTCASPATAPGSTSAPRSAGKPLVKLFSSILKREGDRYFLVTPVEKVGITVDDAPFVAVDFTAEGDGPRPAPHLHHPGRRQRHRRPRPPDPRRPRPRHRRARALRAWSARGLEALIDRKSFYRLVELGGEHDGRRHRAVRRLVGRRLLPLHPRRRARRRRRP